MLPDTVSDPMKSEGPQSPGADVTAAPLPSPPSERGPWLLACSIGLIGVALLVAVLSGAVGRTTSAAP
ncbi:MAG: hypothetical protein JWN81_597, partial [Solirubrobacterales bacterium]|nr:hypothetical protein [Solirubrobacterales bacterium]